MPAMHPMSSFLSRLSPLTRSPLRNGRSLQTTALVLALSTLTACGSFQRTPRYAGDVVATDASQVTRCTFLGDLRSSSGLTGLFAPKGVDNIKQDLLQQADSLEATHVVWDQAAANLDNTSLSGKAYRCPAAANHSRR